MTSIETEVTRKAVLSAIEQNNVELLALFMPKEAEILRGKLARELQGEVYGGADVLGRK